MPVNEREVEELLSDLVRIDSVTPWLIPDGAGEGNIARFIADWLAPLGVEVELEEVEPGRPNLIARLPGTGGGRSLCLNAHSDTVGYANWADRALVPERRGDRLIGVGVADDKSGCAVGLLALRELASSGSQLRGDVVLACTIDEEGSSIGTTDLVRRHTYDGAMVLEPHDVELVVVEHQGFGWLDIIVHGKPAHGSAPDEGIDAIVHMAQVIDGLAALDMRFKAQPDPRNGRTVLHTGTIAGGTDYATYPSQAILGIEIGTQPGETMAARVADIEAIFADCRTRLPGFAAEIRIQVERDPFKAEGHEALLAAAHKASTRTLGRPLQEVGLNAWADAALMQAAGIPTILFGPTGSNYHAPDEWVSLTSCVQAVEIVTATTMDFCA
jgi:acetylornithine deacetylase/succinyl-diaminopimelate desuccinylase-like protein